MRHSRSKSGPYRRGPDRVRNVYCGASDQCPLFTSSARASSVGGTTMFVGSFCFGFRVKMHPQTTRAVIAAKKFRVVAAASWCSPSHDRHHKRIIRRYAPQVLRINSGNLAIFAAIRLASSLESNFTAERRPGFAFLDMVRLGIVLYWSATAIAIALVALAVFAGFAYLTATGRALASALLIVAFAGLV